MVAPSSIPSPRGKSIKTDRLDATQPTQYYANGLLTVISVSDGPQGSDRDLLLRARQKPIEQRTELCQHLQALLRRHGLHYKEAVLNRPVYQ